MQTKSKREYELKDLTLADREFCNNAKAVIRGLNQITIENAFSVTLRWVRKGLKSLDGVEINDDNREDQINTLSNEDIEEISGTISERTNLGTKKKS